MREIDEICRLLDKMNVPYELKARGETIGLDMTAYDLYVGTVGLDSSTVTGYPGFFTRFEFDKHGSFLRMGAWE